VKEYCASNIDNEEVCTHLAQLQWYWYHVQVNDDSSGPLDKGGASSSVFGQNGNRPAAGNFFFNWSLKLLVVECKCLCLVEVEVRSYAL
jgi:hypothetical protein